MNRVGPTCQPLRFDHRTILPTVAPSPIGPISVKGERRIASAIGESLPRLMPAIAELTFVGAKSIMARVCLVSNFFQT